MQETDQEFENLLHHLLNLTGPPAALLAGIQGGVSIMLSTGQSTHLRAALDWWIARLHAASGVAR